MPVSCIPSCNEFLHSRNRRGKLVLRVKAICSLLNKVEDSMILFIEIRHDSFITFSMQFIIY